nr:hypothetical protein [Burkholderia gladioli]
MSTTSTAAPQKVHETKVAIMPLVTIAKEDAGSALDRFDQWLKSVSDGYVTLARVEQLASYIPVVSNIISAVDVVLDIKRLIEAQHKDFFDYLNLGIDLIGIIPVPPVMGEFRMGARPLLKLARQELERSAVAVADGGAQMIADAVISVLVSHLSTKFAGEVEAFIQQVKAKLQQLLDDCANHAHQLLEGLAQIFEKAASGALFDTSGNERAAAQHLKQAGDGFAAHDAGKIAHSLWSYLEDGAKEFVKDTANVATKAANFISPSTNEKLRHLAATARGAIPMVTSKIKGLNSSDVGGLMWLLNALTIAVEKWRALKNHRGQVVGIKEAGTVKAELKKGEGELETLASQAAAKHPGANTCKTCGGGAAAGRSPSSIGFALGDELFAHEDFSLPGVLPIVWLRTSLVPVRLRRRRTGRALGHALHHAPGYPRSRTEAGLPRRDRPQHRLSVARRRRFARRFRRGTDADAAGRSMARAHARPQADRGVRAARRGVPPGFPARSQRQPDRAGLRRGGAPRARGQRAEQRAADPRREREACQRVAYRCRRRESRHARQL